MEHGTLINTLESCVRYWLETIKSEKDREELKDYVRKIESGYNSPDVEADDSELVSSRKVDKMIEKSNENQKEFSKKNGPEEDLDEASNAEWKRKEEEMKKNSQKEGKEKSESEALEPEKKNKADTGGTGEKLARSDKEQRDVDRLLKDEEERMRASNARRETAMEEEMETATERGNAGTGVNPSEIDRKETPMEEGKDTTMERDCAGTRINHSEVDTSRQTGEDQSDSQRTLENSPSPV